MIPLEVKQGTCIVLHGLLPHYSMPICIADQDRPMPSTPSPGTHAIHPKIGCEGIWMT